ncbi:MAG: carbon storage regulator [Gemmatimonadetes bacterium]|nr:carbon storage regulator [Gemmatimonadota bacterium]
MLILQRKPSEAVLIGDDIRIVILRSDGGGVRIGIEAPAEVPILREEIVEEVRSETVRASRAAAGSASGLKPPEPSS